MKDVSDGLLRRFKEMEMKKLRKPQPASGRFIVGAQTPHEAIPESARQ